MKKLAVSPTLHNPRDTLSVLHKKSRKITKNCMAQLLCIGVCGKKQSCHSRARGVHLFLKWVAQSGARTTCSSAIGVLSVWSRYCQRFSFNVSGNWVFPFQQFIPLFANTESYLQWEELHLVYCVWSWTFHRADISFVCLNKNNWDSADYLPYKRKV